ncbi:iron donor protein CyaY [Shewanella sp. MBTL60-007]|uniref:iron donor protein CyaY n=1 Tax=Shewanella sp. MBTL60-007 TaxID=2815911 RepID=UPI001BBB41AA|nr:iron donor protein CyaY [Shewanella sp. MBTL60-007]GIU27672.1 protein CyaY [Shewanella sp. MBTL60-007]
MAMTDFEFHQLVDEIFQTIDNAIEVLIEEQDADVDVDGSGNVLQLEFDGTSKIVINKQEPLHEIWLATQFGGYHFGYVDGKWMDERNGNEFMPFLIESIYKQSGLKLDI